MRVECILTSAIPRLQAIDFTTFVQWTASETMRVPFTSGRREFRMSRAIPLRTSWKTSEKASDAIHKAIAQARAAGGYDLVVVDGPAMPWSPADHRLFDAVDGLVAILPIKLDINDSMEEIITALGETERKLVGVIINELNPTAVNRQRDKQYA